MKDRPKEANDRSEPGHLEMDTVVSCLGGAGGLLVLIDRCTRECFIELLDSISQEAVVRALKRMKRPGLRSPSTPLRNTRGLQTRPARGKYA